jgi:hypothetical protein
MQHLDADPVGVFAWVTRSGRPTSCAVTPYLVDGHPVVTSTAALIAKAAAVRRDDRVALLAGGVQVIGSGAVGFDPSRAGSTPICARRSWRSTRRPASCWPSLDTVASSPGTWPGLSSASSRRR